MEIQIEESPADPPLDVLRDQSDDKLFATLVSDLSLEGGVCQLDMIIVLNSSIRKLLGDRRLMAFFRDHPLSPYVFRLKTSHDDATAEPTAADKVHLLPRWFDTDFIAELRPLRGFDASVSSPNAAVPNFRCTVCGEPFYSRNKLFSHVRNKCSTELLPPAPEGTVLQHHNGKEAVELIHKLISKIPSFKRELVPLRWVATRSVVRWNLRLYVRSLPKSVVPMQSRFEFDTSQWWDVAADQLLQLMKAHNDKFIVTFGPGCNAQKDSTIVAETVSKCADKAPEIVVGLRSDARAYAGEDGENLSLAALLHEVVHRVARRERVSVKRVQTDRTVRNWLIANHGSKDVTVGQILEACPDFEVFEEKRGAADRGAQDVVLVKKNLCRKKERDQDNANMVEVVEDILAPADIVYMDEVSVIVSKPSGVKMESLVENCRRTLPRGDPTFVIQSVSRLDQCTSGAVVLPRSAAAELYLTRLFKNRFVNKWYICVTAGCTALPDRGEVDVKLKHTGGAVLKTFAHPHGKPSLTKFVVLEKYLFHRSDGTGDDLGDMLYSIVACKPVSGRTHQIRAHMAHIGHPLVGDSKYGGNHFRKAIFREHTFVEGKRTMLHSYKIGYQNSSGELVSAKSELPSDMCSLISELEGLCPGKFSAITCAAEFDRLIGATVDGFL